MNHALKVLALLAFAPLIGTAQETAKTSSTGTLAGTITYDGDAPKRKVTAMTEEFTKSCKCKEIPSDQLVVNAENKGIQWVVIEILNCGPEWKAGDAPVVMDQKGCVFIPHVVFLPPSGTLELKNSDETSHNVHSLSTKNASFNKAVEAGSSTKEKLEYAERVQITCDIHAWMGGWAIVTKNRFHAVTNEKGEFEIKDIPPGKYQVQIWHEKLKGPKADVEITAGGKAELNLKLKK